MRKYLYFMVPIYLTHTFSQMVTLIITTEIFLRKSLKRPGKYCFFLSLLINRYLTYIFYYLQLHLKDYYSKHLNSLNALYGTILT